MHLLKKFPVTDTELKIKQDFNDWLASQCRH